MRAALPLFALAACEIPSPFPYDTGAETTAGGKTTTDTVPGAPLPADLEMVTYDGQSGGEGTFEVLVGVEGDVTAFQVTAVSQQYPGLEALYDPSGDLVLHWTDWFYSNESLTNAFFGYDQVTAFDWPIRNSDGPLTEGTWRMVWSITDADYYYVPYEPVTVTIAEKRDPDFTQAETGVLIVYAEGVDDDPDVVEAVEGAVERWREVWLPYDWTLRASYTSSDLDPDLSFAYGGTSDLVPIAAERKDGDLLLVVGERIEGGNSTFGLAAGIPGTLEATKSTYVVVSWLVHAGPDASFDADEIQLMGETMAHEIGHYQGLFHPVESTYTFWDALPDTAQCTAAVPCESQLGANVMFPYSICDLNSCLATDQLSSDQEAVVERYVGSL
jgi:hypothetical protein